MNTCKYCEHWKPYRKRLNTWGDCSNPKLVSEVFLSDGVWCDHPDEYGGLVTNRGTGPDFGCIHWVKK